MNQAANSTITSYNIFTKLFARIWAFWGLITFVITFFIILIPSLATKIIKDPLGMKWFIILAKWWNSFWLFLVACPLKVYGKEHFEKGKIYIVTANHNAFLDVPLLCPFVPGANQTIAKDSFTKIPFFGWYYARGAVLVNRESVVSRKRSYELMKEALKKQFHMCIFPEGSRNKSDMPIAKFQDGAFKLSRDTKVPIIPCVITGTKRAMPRNEGFFFLPTALEIHFLPPVEVGNETIEELKEKVHYIMTEFYKKREDTVN